MALRRVHLLPRFDKVEMPDEKDPASPPSGPAAVDGLAPDPESSRTPESERASEVDSKLTVRERRALHAKEQARKELPSHLLRKSIGPAFVILILAAVAAGFYYTASNTPDCPGHWHAAYGIFVNDSKVSFPNDAAHAAMYNPPSGHDHHLHNNDGIYHFHPGIARCTPTKDMMERLAVNVDGKTLTLGPEHGSFAGTYATEGNATLHILHQPFGGEWTEVSWRSIDGKQLGDGDRILITYGDLTEAQIDAQKATLQDMGNYEPTDV